MVSGSIVLCCGYTKIITEKGATAKQTSYYDLRKVHRSMKKYLISVSNFTLKFRARIVEDGARRPSTMTVLLRAIKCIYGCGVLHGRIEDLVTRRDGQAAECQVCSIWEMRIHSPVLPANLSCRTRLRPHKGTERVDLFHDESFHALDRVFLFEPEVEFL